MSGFFGRPVVLVLVPSRSNCPKCQIALTASAAKSVQVPQLLNRSDYLKYQNGFTAFSSGLKRDPQCALPRPQRTGNRTRLRPFRTVPVSCAFFSCRFRPSPAAPFSPHLFTKRLTSRNRTGSQAVRHGPRRVSAQPENTRSDVQTGDRAPTDFRFRQFASLLWVAGRGLLSPVAVTTLQCPPIRVHPQTVPALLPPPRPALLLHPKVRFGVATDLPAAQALFRRSDLQQQYDTALLDLVRVVVAYQWARIRYGQLCPCPERGPQTEGGLHSRRLRAGNATQLSVRSWLPEVCVPQCPTRSRKILSGDDLPFRIGWFLDVTEAVEAFA